MEALNPVLQQQDVQLAFEEFKTSAENKINSLFSTVIVTTDHEINAPAYQAIMRKIYDLRSEANNPLALHTERFNLGGLSKETCVRLLAILCAMLQNSAASDINARGLRHIVNFENASDLSAVTVKTFFETLNTPELRIFYLNLAKAEALSIPDDSIQEHLKTVMEHCQADTRSKKLRIINSLMGYYQFRSYKYTERFISVMNEFNLSNHEIGEVLKHMFATFLQNTDEQWLRPRFYSYGELLSLIDDREIAFQLGKFIAEHVPRTFSFEIVLNLSITTEQIIELIKTNYRRVPIGAVNTLLRLDNAARIGFFNAALINEFSDKMLHDHQDFLYPISNTISCSLLPRHVKLVLAKRGDAETWQYLAEDVFGTPRELSRPLFAAEAWLANEHLYPNIQKFHGDPLILDIAEILAKGESIERHIALRTMEKTGHIYPKLPTSLREDPIFYEKALLLAKAGDLKIWTALPEAVKSRFDNALEAVKKNISIFRMLPKELQLHPQILDLIKTKALKGDIQAIKILPNEVLTNRNFILALMQVDVSVYPRLPEELKKDRAIIQIVLNKVIEGGFTKWSLLSKEEQLNHENICKVIKSCPRFFACSIMPESMIDHPDILRTLFYGSPEMVDDYLDKPEYRWVIAAVTLAQIVLESDGYLQKGQSVAATDKAARVSNIVKQLPLDLQMVYAQRQAGSGKNTISPRDFDWAARYVLSKIPAHREGILTSIQQAFQDPVKSLRGISHWLGHLGQD